MLKIKQIFQFGRIKAEDKNVRIVNFIGWFSVLNQSSLSEVTPLGYDILLYFVHIIGFQLVLFKNFASIFMRNSGFIMSFFRLWYQGYYTQRHKTSLEIFLLSLVSERVYVMSIFFFLKYLL